MNAEIKPPVIDFLSMKDLAAMFSVKQDTIRKWIRQGKFPPGMKAPGGKRWSRNVIDKYINAGQASPKMVKTIAEALGN